MKPKDSPEIAKRKRAVFRALVRAAERGDPCPTNRALAEMTGEDHEVAASVIVLRLEADGKIAIRRISSSRRQITIVSTGKTTLPTGKPPPPVVEQRDPWAGVHFEDDPREAARPFRPVLMRAPDLQSRDAMLSRRNF